MPNYVVNRPEEFKGAWAPAWMLKPTDYNFTPGAAWDDPISHRMLFGGVKTDNTPIDIVHWGTAGVRVPNFADDFYNHILIEPTVIDAGNVSSDQVRTVKLFNGFFEPVTIDAILGSNIEGISLAGVSPPQVVGALVSLTMTMTISTEGPPDIDAEFLFQFSLGPDIAIEVGGSRVIILPYQAEAPFEEELEWSSEVLVSNDGTEQRIQLRQAPRQKFSGSYHVPMSQVSRAGNIIYGWLGKRWAIAVWSESQMVSFTASDTVPCITGNTDIRVGGLVMVWASESVYEIIEVAVINTGSIQLVRPTVNDYPRGLLMPVRAGVTPANMKVTKTVASAKVLGDFEVVDNIQLTATVPAQFLGEDIYYDEVLMSDGDTFTDDYQNRIDRVDFGTTLDIYAPWKHAKIARNCRYIFQTRDESWTFRRWLHRRDGPQKPYWLPSFENDFTLQMTGLIANTLIVLQNDWRGLNELHKHLAIQYTDNTWRAVTITGSAPLDATTMSLSIDTNLNVAADRVKRISFLGLKRLATSVVKINWIGNAVGECTIPILELEP